jgi:hypothetical protein
MKKLLIVGGVVAGMAFLAKRRGSGGGLDFERMIERLPESAPPKWAFQNITAIRQNTERILQLLEQERTAP